MAVVDRLFVYGPWCKGGVQFRFIEPYIEEISEGYVLGQCWRLNVGYPVYVARGTDRIPGQIVTVRGPDLLWRLLEEFHGVHPTQPELSLFERVSREAWLYERDHEQSQSVVVFAVPETKVSGDWAAVPHGDWRMCLRNTPAIPEVMTERQKAYVKKLGRSTGREIIPIDLDLYRELMKLQLIVDKGRRLALSPLGREVLRYLQV